MFNKIIDLSIPLENNAFSDPVSMLPRISYTNHKESVAQMAHFFPGLSQQDLPDGEAWATEHVELSTHNGTHLDAPYHYASTMDKGSQAITIDQIPLQWCLKPGVKLDFTSFEGGYVVTVQDVQSELKRIDYEIQPLDIVLINTKAGKLYGTKEYLSSGCGMGREATLYLLEKGVKLTGTDAWSWDAPFVHTAAKYAKEKDPAIIWEGHKAGRERGYCHLEKLTNLESLPSHGFHVCCFPIKIKNGSAGWTRAVALLSNLCPGELQKGSRK
ncbi:MAG TPA: cyclase family protein [Chlamydiales bacterium]|nr:cyclase family protein [Chlamydiales bacterium]